MERDDWVFAVMLGIVLSIVFIGIFLVVMNIDGNTTEERSLPYSISRFIDSEAGVVCYHTTGDNQGGIDCLLITKTRLETAK